MKKLILFVGMFVAGSSRSQQFKTLPTWDYPLPIAQRVNDLVSRLRLEEKIGQMLHAAPTITLLGIPAYGWWDETLHGVVRTPYHIPSYPQAIAMAATWDTGSLYLMPDYSATEHGNKATARLSAGRKDSHQHRRGATANGQCRYRQSDITYQDGPVNKRRDNTTV